MKIQPVDLCHSFPLARFEGPPVLAGVELEIEAGGFTVILGESGSGKSTLLNLMAGLLLPTSGRVLASDREVMGPSPELSVLFQQPSLLPWLTVRENIVFGCQLRGDRQDLTARADQLIATIGLSGSGERYPAELSVGMAQRVCLARALIGSPRALLLDEPFGALDICNRTRLQAALLDIWRRQRFTAVLVTHDIDEALVVGETVVILGGRPSSVQAQYHVDLPYPRDVAGQDFFEARARLYSLLQEATSVGAKAGDTP